MPSFFDKTKLVFGLGKKDTSLIIGGIPQEILAPKIEEPLQKKQLPEPQKPTQKEEPEFRKGTLPKIERYWQFLKVTGKGTRTIQEYRYEYRWWERKASDIKKSIYALKVTDIEDSLIGIHPSTVRRKVSFLKGLGRWYLREGKAKLHTEVSKFITPKIPERLPGDHGQKKFIELRHQARELCEQNERLGVWLGLMLLCGLRISEIRTAKVKDERFVQVIGKGNKERLVPALNWLLNAMNRIKGAERGGWVKSRYVIYQHVKRIGYKPHSLRHTYASELLRRGKNIEEIRVLLGHADISTTSIYARVDIPFDAAELLDR